MWNESGLFLHPHSSHRATKIKLKQGNRRYQTLPSTTFAAEQPHRRRPELFWIIFALAWHTEWPRLLHYVIGDWMIPVAATVAAKIANTFEWPGQPPKIVPYLRGSAPPSNTWFRGPTRVFIQNGMSIGSAVFAQRTVECSITLQWAATFSSKNCPFSLGNRVPHVTHGT